MSRTACSDVLLAASSCAEQTLLHHARMVGAHKPYITVKSQAGFWRSWSVHDVSSTGANQDSAELQEIMQKSGETPTTTYLGVSPPVRSGCCGGAANPWSHDRSWKSAAYSASHSNLEALRELDSEGESFLKAQSCPALDVLLGALAGPGAGQEDAAAAAASGAPADGADSSSASTCGSGKLLTPFACHTAYFRV